MRVGVEHGLTGELAGVEHEAEVAVAPLARLAGWALPLLRPGGVLLALKGASAGTEVARDAGTVLRPGVPDHAVATSKSFRSLARVCGAAPYGEGPMVKRVLPADVQHAGAVVVVAERLYRRSLLQTGGKLSMRQAWSAPE